MDRPKVNWVHPDNPNWTRPQDRLGRPIFDRLLEAGTHKAVEADSQHGPWTDAPMLDNGDIIIRKRWVRIVPKHTPEG